MPTLADAAAAAVRQRYASLRPFYSNLLDDFGATDTFVVDGDALLVELLGSERLDWSHGGQFLQLRAQLEQFVAGVQAANSAGLRWWVAWFDCNRGLLPGGAAHAARALTAACLLGTLGVPALRFPSWWSEQWHEWLAAARPAMLLLTDLPQQGGADGGGEAAENALQPSAAAPAEVAAQAAERRRLHLQAYIVAAQAAGLQCAFLSELRFTAEGRMHAFRTGWRAAPGTAGRAPGADAGAAEAQAVGIDFAAKTEPPKLSLDVGPLLELAAKQAAPGQGRAALGTACCGAAVALTAATVPAAVRQLFAEAWCLHELLLRCLSLAERSRQLPPSLPAIAGGSGPSVLLPGTGAGFDDESTPYEANYHWHSGKPIDAAQLEAAEQPLDVTPAVLAGLSLEEMAASQSLPPFVVRRATQALQQIELLIKAGFRSDAQHQERTAKDFILQKAKDNGRAWQMFYRHQEQYAKSLDAAKFSRPPARTSGGRSTAQHGGASSRPAGWGGAGTSGSKAQAGLSKVEQMRRENSERLAAKSGGSAGEQWGVVRKRLEAAVAKAGWSREVAGEAAALLSNLAAKSAGVYLEAATWRVSQLSLTWEAAARPPRSTRGTGGSSTMAVGERQEGAGTPLAVELWAAVADILQRGLLQPGGSVPEEARLEAATACRRALKALGLVASAEHLAAVASSSAGGSGKSGGGKGAGGGKRGGSSKESSKTAPSGSKEGTGGSSKGASSDGSAAPEGLGLSDTRFQLRHCGPLLPHEAPPERDPRVQSFNPDPWQRQVLDAVDAGASALVVAPTSSGKTFISNYTISSVVQRAEDPDGVVVFVAPTKALVNQVTAQVYKNFEGSEASTGVFTKDYRHNTETCRILVTVPACLEILLLSPTSQPWVRRIRYAILDEVHCLNEVHLGEGGARDGAGSTWEHILLLLRCPFLALSATIDARGAVGRCRHVAAEGLLSSTLHWHTHLCFSGNPEEFSGWLAGVKRLQSQQDAAAGRAPEWGGPGHYDVRLIQHYTRHSDLRLHTYQPRCLDGEAGDSWRLLPALRVASLEGRESRAQGRAGGGGGLGGTGSLGSGSLNGGSTSSGSKTALPLDDGCSVHGELRRLNPLALLQIEDLMQGSFPPELSLEPADVEQLYDGLVAAASSAQGTAWHAQVADRLAALAPERFFAPAEDGAGAGSGPFITRQQVRRYEAELKSLLLAWAAGSEAEGRAAAAATLASVRAAQYQPAPEHDSTLRNGRAMVGLTLDLLRRGQLPAIAFSFEHRVCHRLAEAVVEYLEACEAADREVNAEAYSAARREAEEAAKRAKAARDRKPDKRRGGGEEQGEEASAPGGWDEEGVLPEFSLAGKPKTPPQQEGWTLQNDPLVRGLKRGIAIHHGGLPKVYRQVCEILFRAGHLRMVFATGTLAFGIHMPCRTVVFAGDHLFLNALLFRQMMGRAGRRGFDPLGNVVFFGVGPRKIRNLMISPVPRLRGHFPLNITICLRALALHHIVASPGGKAAASSLVGRRRAGGGGSATKEVAGLACDTLATLFQRPFYAEGRQGLLQRVQHLFGFAAEFLSQAGAIGPGGEPVGLAGMLCHLHWTDPANLALASLLNSGVLDAICMSATEGMSADAFEPVAEQLLVLFSHLFQCLPLHRAVLAQPERFLHSTSKVVLEPLSPAAQAALDRHNSAALSQLVAYVQRYVAGLGPDGGASERATEPLPLSGLRVPVATGVAAPSPALLALLASAPRVEAAVCSPYAALSGRGDDFSSMYDLVRSVRAGVLLDIASAPTVGMADRHGQAVPLNRFALDYYKHGQKSALVTANGLREGDAWQVLSAFSDILRVVAVSLARLLPPSAFHPVAYSLDRLAREFAAKFKRFNDAPGPRGGY
ncbi:DEAD DEAH box [Chlorella sorokiniana]|uniref:DEAD DEAH box n=1 Tax=Chlorella sorokiniana TaxID=3076 RepID=A0A2P6TUL6_CHLSO|nr:DEAD DEAH box [Chlorella sorokiniana]|eukprot:PRW57760.1 DEAD DEAH box [Chlorella sorokiniana]